MFELCRNCVCNMSGKCLESVWRMFASGSCLKCVWVWVVSLSEVCLRRVWAVSEACLGCAALYAVYHILVVSSMLVCFMLRYVPAFATLHYITLNVICHALYYVVTGSSQRG